MLLYDACNVNGRGFLDVIRFPKVSPDDPLIFVRLVQASFKSFVALPGQPDQIGFCLASEHTRSSSDQRESDKE